MTNKWPGELASEIYSGAAQGSKQTSTVSTHMLHETDFIYAYCTQTKKSEISLTWR